MKDEEKDTGRIEAFSDGVFAIAITLLATAAVFISPFVTIGICTALWVFWAFTMRRVGAEINPF
jgi:hypothetical protein